MAAPSIRFQLDGGRWVAERESVGFSGMTAMGEVEFLITSEALAYLVSPELDTIDSEMAIEAFTEFEADISSDCPARVRQATGRGASHLADHC